MQIFNPSETAKPSLNLSDQCTPNLMVIKSIFVLLQLDPDNSSATFGTPHRHQLESFKPCKNITKRSDIYSKQPGCKRRCGPGQCEKSCEIKGGSQETAVIV